ncbi:MAG TPA: ribbon-helix-helix domain-containing protein [Bacillus sp. (in: Bacteria)]|uniref:Ribbon-helix-helix domain-containing protein n=4 Tax=Bacillus cereus group TaxID=86661 RepID=A0A9X7G6L0_BACCE|nr:MULTISPECIES: ribbon-helix-helix domain-containing protein [Bacillus]MCU7391379.1 ribbon-helix-helix domain-containing protein [Bacillus sp. ST24]CGG43573.1 Ribbon-helix-helix domain [Streptococcus pneumoniae]HCF52324.1 ribbon-helix-helix domain-containing protein [Bacillus sp. (in: firmicutes)]AHX20120.1 CopG family transcriptional regulator [Bacillus bombysepticus str. Wang]AKR37164.1 Transcripitonal regulator [Bacillus thuringiensis serovar indiana]
MTIGEIIDGLNRREPIAIIAKRLEISPYTLSKKLRLIGYEYDGEQKKRIFVGDGEEPRHLQLQEATALQYEKTDYQLLIYEQLQSIYELLRKREEVIVPIMSKSTEKKRRTFSINTEILSQLDLISESKGVQKSKLVEEALHQFLQQYEVDKTSHFDN